MTDTLAPAKSGNLVASGDTAIIKARSGDNGAGFNTVFADTTGAGTFYVECSPNFLSDPSNALWFDVDGTNSQLTADGHVSFQMRAEAFRVRINGFTDTDWWVF